MTWFQNPTIISVFSDHVQCQLLGGGGYGRESLGSRLSWKWACKSIIRECFWNHHLQKERERSRLGLREKLGFMQSQRLQSTPQGVLNLEQHCEYHKLAWGSQALCPYVSQSLDFPRKRTWPWVTLTKATEKKTDVWELFADCILSNWRNEFFHLEQGSVIPSTSVSLRISRYRPNNTAWYGWYTAFSQWLAVEYVDNWYIRFRNSIFGYTQIDQYILYINDNLQLMHSLRIVSQYRNMTSVQFGQRKIWKKFLRLKEITH